MTIVTLLLLLFIPITWECAPTVHVSNPIVSSTYSPDSSPDPPTTTTQTASTTTAPNTTTIWSTSTALSTTVFDSTTTFEITSTAPNTTTTVPTTTTTLITTTVRPCCSWPFPAGGINTISLTMNQWDQCSQSLSYQCALGNVSTNVIAIGISTRINIESNAYSMTLLNSDQVRFNTTNINSTIDTNLICNTTTHLWFVNSVLGEQFDTFACAYLYSNGSWHWR
ncbi:hypothetical protein CRE_07627 [Caenorhabditis remanei]|uniref:C6 domain-containing protein n=1 Tax=Caenorhabditis remanei TaxID=31234 RepID=E3MPA9_CAERE|nr:hypothetical protein CRE_07627 [Caenorhabditis remanei]